MVVINQNIKVNSDENNSPEITLNSNLKRWFSRNIGLWKSNRTYFLEEEKKNLQFMYEYQYRECCK